MSTIALRPLDGEVVELLRGKPELLAIAHAIVSMLQIDDGLAGIAPRGFRSPSGGRRPRQPGND